MVSDVYDDVCTSDEGEKECELADFEDVANGKVESVDLSKLSSYATRLGATSASSVSGHAFVNGRHFPFNEVTHC